MVVSLDWEKIALFFAGLGTGVAIGWILKDAFSRYQTTLKREIKNVETWDMKEMADGSIKVTVHRNVQEA